MTQLPGTDMAEAGREGPVATTHVGADATVALTATALATLAWVAARAAGIALTVGSGSGTRDVTLTAVVVTSLVVATAGAGLLRVLERRTPRARRVWTVVAVLVWAVSLLGPLSATASSGLLVLVGLHLLVGAVLVVGLRRTHPPVPAGGRADA